MGKKPSAVRCFVARDLCALLASAKLCVVLSCVFLGLLTCFRGLGESLSASGGRVNPLELYAVCVSNRVSLWIVYIGEVVLLCDAPFRRRGDCAAILRAGRKRWLTGQLLFAALCVLLYTLFLLLFFLGLSWGHWSFSAAWSETFLRGSVSQESVGIRYAIVFHPALRRTTPWLAFLCAAALQLLFGLVLAAVTVLLHLLARPKLGIVFCTVFPLTDYLLLTTLDFPWCWTAARFVSPYSLSTLSRLSGLDDRGPSVAFALLYLTALLLGLLAASYRRVRFYDFFSSGGETA